MAGTLPGSLASAETVTPDAPDTDAIHFPQSYLYCAPTDAGIWVRVQIECRGRLVDTATGAADEYVMGVPAKTGLTTDPRTGERTPGYDYWIIFSNSHVFTKRSHASAHFNNPTVLKHSEFGMANWRLRRVPAERLRSGVDVQRALENWRELSATTTWTSDDGKQQFTVDYPVKWADYTLNGEGFRVETGPVFLLDPNRLRVGAVPRFEDFQWTHLDYRSLTQVRCLIERPTSILVDARFTPPDEHGRENRENPPLTREQLARIESTLFTDGRMPLPPETMRSLFSTDHYSAVEQIDARTQLYSLGT